MHILIAFVLLISSSHAIAGPQMMVCLSDCSQRQMIKISSQAWSDIITIFNNQSETDQDELNKIASALLCIEKDIILQFTPSKDQQNNQQAIDLTFTNKDETFNARQALILFLDNGFIQRHLLRNSQKRTVWLINNESAAALQSRMTGKIYIIDPTSSEFGSEPEISLYDEWKDEKSIKRLPEEINKLFLDTEPTMIEHDDF